MEHIHVAFIVESAHGHINPILGMICELARRGHRVTCPVKGYFAERIRSSGGEPLVYTPLDQAEALFPKIRHYRPHKDAALIAPIWKQFELEEAKRAIAQLHRIYASERPDLIVYDFRNLAGRFLAKRWGIAKLEHAPMMIHDNAVNQLNAPYDDELVVVSLPKFFQPDAASLDARFQFVGATYTNRKFFEPWKLSFPQTPLILVSATTAGSRFDYHDQSGFYRTVVAALEDFPCMVVLSVEETISEEALGPLPGNVIVNRSSSQLEILAHAALYIGQGGQATALEALYCGVPMLLMPPDWIFVQIAHRVAELGLGVCLDPKKTTAEALRAQVASLLQDEGLLKRVRNARETMRAPGGAQLAADLMMQHFNRHSRSRDAARAGPGANEHPP